MLQTPAPRLTSWISTGSGGLLNKTKVLAALQGRRGLTGRETEGLLALCKQAEQSEDHCQHLQRNPGTQILLKYNSSNGEHFLCAQMN